MYSAYKFVSSTVEPAYDDANILIQLGLSTPATFAIFCLSSLNPFTYCFDVVTCGNGGVSYLTIYKRRWTISFHEHNIFGVIYLPSIVRNCGPCRYSDTPERNETLHYNLYYVCPPSRTNSSPRRRFGAVAVTSHTYGNVPVPAVAYLTSDQMKFYPL